MQPTMYVLTKETLFTQSPYIHKNIPYLTHLILIPLHPPPYLIQLLSYSGYPISVLSILYTYPTILYSYRNYLIINSP